jgi:hypothetical protein
VMGPTLILFLITVAAWVALEFWFVFRGQPSISGRIWAANRAWPPLSMFTALVIGLLLGHFFFGQCGPM